MHKQWIFTIQVKAQLMLMLSFAECDTALVMSMRCSGCWLLADGVPTDRHEIMFSHVYKQCYNDIISTVPKPKPTSFNSQVFQTFLNLKNHTFTSTVALFVLAGSWLFSQSNTKYNCLNTVHPSDVIYVASDPM